MEVWLLPAAYCDARYLSRQLETSIDTFSDFIKLKIAFSPKANLINKHEFTKTAKS